MRCSLTKLYIQNLLTEQQGETRLAALIAPF